MTDPLGQSQVLPYLIRLSRIGYSFTILSFEKRERYANNKQLIRKICADASIQWIPLRYTKKPPVLSTIWDYLKMLKNAKGLHAEKRFEIVHCRSYIASIAGLSMKKKYGIKFLFDMRGFWADERVDGNLWNLKNPLYKRVYQFFKKKEREFLEFSDEIISLTKTAKEEMLSWNIPGVSSQKMKVIPCAADFELFSINTAQKRKDAKLKIGIKDEDFTLSYIGSIGTWYLLEEMVHFFSVLKAHFSNAKFLILTPASPKIIKNVFEKFHLDFTDAIVRFAERDELPSLAHASDLSIFFIKPVYSKISSSPTKMGEILSMGIPIICNDGIGDVKEIIEKTNSGFCIRDFREKTYNEVILQLKQRGEFNPQKIREAAKPFFNLDNGLKSYLDVYKSLLKK